jgi:hypothetical protein
LTSGFEVGGGWWSWFSMEEAGHPTGGSRLGAMKNVDLI